MNNGTRNNGISLSALKFAEITQKKNQLVIIPAKAFARDYVITGVRLSVCLSVCLFVCLLPR